MTNTPDHTPPSHAPHSQPSTHPHSHNPQTITAPTPPIAHDSNTPNPTHLTDDYTDNRTDNDTRKDETHHEHNTQTPHQNTQND
ncbi:hypothetical protein [Streptomyces sp. MMBL 11-3]|uniref:hypothetical protein n=1 Tax=Streptomyces sp. MMBL 11-3 TaxID=3382639 RepID=UPI0039B4A743